MAMNNPADAANAAAGQSHTEADTPSFSTDELAKMAQQLQGTPSLLDGIDLPIDMEAVKKKIFDSLLHKLAQLADNLGYGWVGGVNAPNVGDGYIYVPSGQSADAGNNYTFTGPGYRPDLNGPPDGYKSDIRTTIEFVNPHLTFADTRYSNPRWLDQTPSNLTTFEVDNGASTSPVTTNFSLEYSSQGQAGAATSKSWQNSWHFSASATETINEGDMEKAMFPSVTLSFTQEGGMAGQTGGGQSISNTVTSGVRSTYSFSHQTPGGRVGHYKVTAIQGRAAVDFTAMATLEFGVTFHGFLRWGGGKPFQGGTNYHNKYSGSGDRPIFPFTLGSKDQPFWEALREMVSENADPWNWNAMFQQIAGSKQNCDTLIANAKAMCTFPVSGVVASISRYNLSWGTISESLSLGGASTANADDQIALNDNSTSDGQQPVSTAASTPPASTAAIPTPSIAPIASPSAPQPTEADEQPAPADEQQPAEDQPTVTSAATSASANDTEQATNANDQQTANTEDQDDNQS